VRDPEDRLQPHAQQRPGQRPARQDVGGRGGRCALDATDKNVSIGGAGLAASAVDLGLVDELRMFRYPVVVGGGTPFLPPVTEDVPLDLVETRTLGSRVIYERYRRVRDDSN
jgi:dihydrofolate reductase